MLTKSLIQTVKEFEAAIPKSSELKKQIDFEKEKLLLFAWEGSGGDRLNATISDDKKTIIFNYKVRLTFDIRRHLHLFVIPEKMDYKIKTIDQVS